MVEVLELLREFRECFESVRFVIESVPDSQYEDCLRSFYALLLEMVGDVADDLSPDVVIQTERAVARQWAKPPCILQGLHDLLDSLNPLDDTVH